MSIELRVAGLIASLPSAAGKRAVVTGGNSGIGLETARLLARSGATVVLAARDPQKGEAAKSDLLNDVPGADIAVERLDLASLASVRSFAERVASTAGLDLLIANAGVMALPRSETEDGFEMQFGVNHLGHFALTGLLLPALRERPGARVVIMTSAAAFMGRIDFDDLMGHAGYGRWRAYAQSKLANLLFARALAHRLTGHGLGVSAHASHPGLVYTNLQRNVVALSTRTTEGEPGATQDGQAARLSAGERFFLERVTPFFGQSAQMGALPQTFAALSPAANSGDLWGPRWLQVRGRPVTVRGPSSGSDRELQDRLWAVSEELTGITYPENASPEPAHVEPAVPDHVAKMVNVAASGTPK